MQEKNGRNSDRGQESEGSAHQAFSFRWNAKKRTAISQWRPVGDSV
jgi:hypothetical protein